MKLEDIKAFIQKELGFVEQRITKALQAEIHPGIFELNSYIGETPGKRLRPSLAILAYHLCGSESNSVLNKEHPLIKVATAIELIHMASLVHDDIIDHASLRHNKPSIAAKYGMETAIPSGVYLYSLALKEISLAGNFDVLRVTSHAVKHLCQGELSQVMDRGKVPSVLSYLTILKKKTGVLFSAACQCGAFIAGADKTHRFSLKQFGSALGLVFQIGDDILDIFEEDKGELKKQAGQDLELGELTLPILYLIENATEDEKAELLNKIALGDRGFLKQKIGSNPRVVQQSKEKIDYYTTLAKSSIDSFSGSEFYPAFNGIIQLVEKRTRQLNLSAVA